MTSPYLERPAQSAPSAGDVIGDAAGLLYENTSLLAVVRWIEANCLGPFVLIERTGQMWRVWSIGPDTEPALVTEWEVADPHGRVKRPRRWRG